MKEGIHQIIQKQQLLVHVEMFLHEIQQNKI